MEFAFIDSQLVKIMLMINEQALLWGTRDREKESATSARRRNAAHFDYREFQ